MPITECSIHIRIHRTAHTPVVEAGKEALIEVAHGERIEAHDIRVRRSNCFRRRRLISIQDPSEDTRRNKRDLQRGISEAAKFRLRRQPPPHRLSDLLVKTIGCRYPPNDEISTWRLLPHEPGVVVPHRCATEDGQDSKSRGARQILVPVLGDACKWTLGCIWSGGNWSDFQISTKEAYACDKRDHPNATENSSAHIAPIVR